MATKLHQIPRRLHNKTRTTPYHPQCDGLVERWTLLNMLAICAKDHPFAGSITYDRSAWPITADTPCYLMFGRQVRLPVDIMYRPIEQQSQSYGEYAKLLQDRLQTAFDLVRTHVNKAISQEFYNRKIHLVWLHSPVPKRASCRKLHHPWTGPFKVLKQ